MKTLFQFALAGFCIMVSGTFGFAQEYEVASKPLRVKFDGKDIAAPSIFLVYKNSGVLNSEGRVEVEIRILDEGGITRVSINDENLEGESKDSVVFSRVFNPNEEVSVTARDNFNNVKEKSFTVKGQPSVIAVTETSKHRFHALLIGIDEYHDQQVPQLSEPIKDATLLKTVITEKYTFEEKDVTLLKNPTYEEISVAFEELSRKVGPTDFLLIFYAGHGYFDTRTNIGYWWPSDAVQKNTAKWFRNSALVENIGAINSKHTLLIADACFSGGIFKTRSPVKNNASPDIGYMMRKASRKAMTSGSLTTVPDKSIFMRYLLKTLSENENKYLPSEDMFDDIRAAMKNNSATRPLYGEIQNVGDEGGDFVLIKKE